MSAGGTHIYSSSFFGSIATGTFVVEKFDIENLIYEIRMVFYNEVDVVVRYKPHGKGFPG